MREVSGRQEKIRVIIADDHLMVRTGLRVMLGTTAEIDLVGEASDGAEAVLLVEEQQPQVVLMDLRMPGVDGIEAIRQMRERWPDIAVIILTTYNEDDLMIRGLQAGARGFLLKDVDLEVLLQAIRAGARNEILVPPVVMERLLARAAQTTQSHPERVSNRTRIHPALSEREVEVLSGVARGERSKEIAARLNITERTVTSYLTTIYSKLGVDSRASAVAVALERGILPRQRE
jgi:NarL family two-component system response regulator YdfI